tara:strand:+ start:25762 stop:28983 length:3222 start_codon:yes stop_codon:yes gene_type:complete
MKQYPRIYSLSTINIIHHQAFDYKFHPFRTDFSGESGVGKSIVTDLIQLILIGSTEYESATDSNDDRPFYQLVLESKEKGDFGYAFLNIETAKNKFLVIGAFIERNKNSSQAFIIQKNIGFEELTLEPFDSPLTIESFSLGQRWLPINDLKLHFANSHQYGIKKYNHFNEYHQILEHNKLLPIDLYTNPSTLKDYARILQAFSRKGIDVKNQVPLHEFLFGKEKATLFYQKYLEAVKNMQEDDNLFERNQSEIDEVENKRDKLINLYEARKLMHNSEVQFINSKWNFKSQIKAEKQGELDNLLAEYFQCKSDLSELNDIANNKQKSLKEELKELTSSLKVKEKSFIEWIQKKSILDDIDELMKLLNLDDINLVMQAHKNFRDQIEGIKNLEFLQTKLEQQGILKAFELLDPSKKVSIHYQELQKQLSIIDEKIVRYKNLRDFNDLKDSTSLAYWVINQGRSFTASEESVIRHFQALKTVMPLKLNSESKFLPDPSLLLKNIPQKINKKDIGFWMDLNGIQQYIIIPDTLVLNLKNRDELTDYFTSSLEDITIEIKSLKKERETKHSLLRFLQNLDNPNKYLVAWRQKDKYKYEEEHLENEILKSWNSEQLEVAVKNIFNQKDDILQIYNDVNKLIDALRDKKSKTEILQKSLNDFQFVKADIYNKIEKSISAEKLKDLKKPANVSINNDLDTYFNAFRTLYVDTNNILKASDSAIELQQEINDLEKELQLLVFNHPDIIDKEIVENTTQLMFEDSKNKWDSASAKYGGIFDAVIQEFISNDAVGLKENKSFRELSEILLPKIFKGVSFEESEVLIKISDYLKEILRRLKDLNENKLRVIREILKDVNDEVSKQTDLLRNIRLFFNQENTKISGNLKANLKTTFDTRINTQWITTFVTKFNQSGGSLFKDAEGFNEEMRGKTSLREKIEYFYQRYGENAKPNVSIKELLNPFSYYNLNYTIITKGGVKNSGSTGQTYTSIALLCIAKLSLIESNNKKNKEGLRFMSIDETESIGSNFDMLSDIAEEYDYQIISMSINPVKLIEGQQYIYHLSRNLKTDWINHHPAGIFSEVDER